MEANSGPMPFSVASSAACGGTGPAAAAAASAPYKGIAFGLDRPEVGDNELQAGELPADLRRQPRRQRPAVAGQKPVQARPVIRSQRLEVDDPLRREKPPDAVG